MLLPPAVAIVLLTLCSLINHSAAGSLQPPVLPLTVRSPYFSSWLPDARKEPWSRWPIFWSNAPSLGFSLMAFQPDRNIAYPLLGAPHEDLPPTPDGDEIAQIAAPNYLGAKYDVSTTNLTYALHDDTLIEVSFSSPVTPTSSLRQSIPASYINVEVTGRTPLNIYIDVNAAWVTGNGDTLIKWDHSEVNGSNPTLQQWVVQPVTPLLYTETNDRPEWGEMHLVAPKNAQWQSGHAPNVRGQFARYGKLVNECDDPNPRSAWNDHEPVFAFSQQFDFDDNETETQNALFTLSLIQDPVIQFTSSDGRPRPLTALWKNWFKEVDDLVAFHYYDYDDASVLANQYQARIQQDAVGTPEGYVDFVALSARQIIGALAFTGSADNTFIFMKELSSDGNAQTVDVIYPAYPFFLYSSPRWLSYLLEPLFEYQTTGQYPNKYSVHDLGTHFPNATGHDDGNDEQMPVEECGNMLIMSLLLVNSLRYPALKNTPWTYTGHKSLGMERLPSHSAPSGPPPPETSLIWVASTLFPLDKLTTVDGIGYIDAPWPGATSPNEGKKLAKKWINRYFHLLEQWTGYLVLYALEPDNQLSTDDFAGKLALQSNLALKGIIGIRAMSEIANFVGHTDDANKYLRIATSYAAEWEKKSLDKKKDHAKLAYDIQGSWTNLYNLYSDSLLCFESNEKTTGNPSARFIPDRVYKRQSDFYPKVIDPYGLPLDSRHPWTKTDWAAFTMGITSRDTRQKIFDSLAYYINETNLIDVPLSDLVNSRGGHFSHDLPHFMARPVVGAHFSLLAMAKVCGGNVPGNLSFLDRP